MFGALKSSLPIHCLSPAPDQSRIKRDHCLHLRTALHIRLASLLSNSFVKRFGALAIANVLSNLMVPLAGIIDTAFLGHLADIHHLGGVAIATVIFNLVYWSFGFLRMGTTGLTAQAYGRRDVVEIRLVVLRNCLLAVVLSSIILILQTPIRELGFWLLETETNVRLSGETFYNARIWGAPAVLVNYVLLGWFLGCGQGKRVGMLSLVGNGGNILLDYWFIRQLGWASAGAGAATAISQGMMLIVGIAFVLRDCSVTEVWQLRTRLWHRATFYSILRLNRDILVRTFSLLMSFALFTNWSSAMGTGILAANTLLLQVVTLASYLIDGIAFATESFAGQFYGSSNQRQLRNLVLGGVSLSVFLGLTMALIFALFPQPLFQIMTQHQSVIDQVKTYVWWVVPTLGFGAIAFLLDGYFLGITAGKWLRNSTILATAGGFLPIGWIAYWSGTPHLLWLALVSFMAIRAITLAIKVPHSWREEQASATKSPL